jgi:hypothetical protein
MFRRFTEVSTGPPELSIAKRVYISGHARKLITNQASIGPSIRAKIAAAHGLPLEVVAAVRG